MILATFASACGGGTVATTTADADVDADRVYRPDAAPPTPDAGAPFFTYHGGRTLSSMHVAFVYIDDEAIGGAPSFDGFADALFASSHWSTLGEYGIKPGTRTLSVRVPRSAIFPDGSIDAQGLIDQSAFGNIAQAYLHGTNGPRFPGADATVFFLPAKVNIVLGQRGSYKWRTCWDADAFHSTDGIGDAYIVIPPCSNGRSTVALSHELGETATDPDVYTAWYAESEQFRSGGELSDLCDKSISTSFGYQVGRYWSESQRRCTP